MLTSPIRAKQLSTVAGSEFRHFYVALYGPIADKKRRHVYFMRIGSVKTDLCIMYFLSVPHLSLLSFVEYILSDARTHYQLHCADELQ